MCGIVFSLRVTKTDCKIVSPFACHACDCVNLSDDIKAAVANRGPDSVSSIDESLLDSHINLFSSVLHIRGPSVTIQPVKSVCGNYILAWNGESYSDKVQAGTSDTLYLMDQLASNDWDPQTVLETWDGPFSFVFLNLRDSLVWFGRDKLGRRSLCFNDGQPGNLYISSVLCSHSVEIPAGTGIYKLQLNNLEISHHPWLTQPPFMTHHFWPIENMEISPEKIPAYSKLLLSGLEDSVAAQLRTIDDDGRIGLLFSGGIDSTVLAILLARAHPGLIDLINVSFAADSPDFRTALVSFSDLQATFPGRFQLIGINISPEEVEGAEEEILRLAAPQDSLMDFNISASLWFASRGIGNPVKSDFTNFQGWSALKAATLASESPDACTFQLSAPKLIVSDDSRCGNCNCRKPKPDCPFFLCKPCCLRRGPGCPSHDKRKQDLEISPFNRSDYLESTTVRSACKVLFVGHGADEWLGGYGRYKTREVLGSLEQKKNEMLKDMQRFWLRNLGRDDRAISAWGREVRHPFWDERSLSIAGQLPLAVAGEDREAKWLLREMVSQLLPGNFNCVNFRKRAIQFGTRISQTTNIRLLGSHRKGKGSFKFRT